MAHATRTTGDAARRPSPRPRTAETEEDCPLETVQSDHADPPKRRFRRGRWFWTLTGLGVVTLLLLCLTGWLFWQDRASSAAQTDRDNVVLAARQGVLNLTGLSHTDTDQAYARLLQGATGDFRNQLAQQSDSFKEALTQGQVASSGQISEAGVEQLDGDTATALVVATANVKNTQAPQGENRQYRLRVTLQRQDGQWLISELEFVA